MNNSLKNFIKKEIEESILSFSYYSWNPSTKEVIDDKGNILKSEDGTTTLKFNSKLDANNYLERKNINGSIREMTGTGAVAPYSTPFAFSGGNSDKKRKDSIAAKSMPGGKVVGENITTDTNGITEGRGKYYNFRESNQIKSKDSKISYLIFEIRKMIREINTLVNISDRLHHETGAKPKWKRTQSDIVDIYNHIKEISKKLKKYE